MRKEREEAFKYPVSERAASLLGATAVALPPEDAKDRSDGISGGVAVSP
jgi:hypothetical protein